uniref:Uncharacterized protein n=1 Tax=Amphimedon queenslandica TaxID=400682 RepID=A0A1X7TXS1_AMPQE
MSCLCLCRAATSRGAPAVWSAGAAGGCGRGPPPSSGGPPITGGGPPASGGGPPATGGRPPATSGGPPATDGGPPASGGGRPPSTNGGPPATFCLLSFSAKKGSICSEHRLNKTTIRFKRALRPTLVDQSFGHSWLKLLVCLRA